jgi:hypothetical protein
LPLRCKSSQDYSGNTKNYKLDTSPKNTLFQGRLGIRRVELNIRKKACDLRRLSQLTTLCNELAGYFDSNR